MRFLSSRRRLEVAIDAGSTTPTPPKDFKSIDIDLGIDSKTYKSMLSLSPGKAKCMVKTYRLRQICIDLDRLI